MVNDQDTAADPVGTGRVTPIVFAEQISIAYSGHREDWLMRRGIAMWLDFFVIAAIVFMPIKLIPLFSESDSAHQIVGIAIPSPAGLMCIVLAGFAYYICLEGIFGWTLGKRLLGLRVVNAEGRAPGIKSSLIRTLFRLIEVNPIVIAGLPAFVFAGISKTGRRLGDRAAKTYVVYARDLREVQKATAQPNPQVRHAAQGNYK